MIGALDISFSISGTFFPGNIFTAQLSDVNGSFANAINIGTTEGVTGGNIPVMFPKNLPFGGNYKIRVISNGPSVVGTSSGYITLLSLPEPVIIQNGDTVSVGSFSSYQWFLNNVLITGATQSEYIVTEVGNYTVTVELNGCYNTSDSYFVEAKTFEWQVNLFPNPTSGKFKLQIYNLKNKPLSIKMFDVLGELIYKEELRVDVKNYLQQFDINNLSDGIYYLQIQSDKLHLVKPVILTKL